MPERKAPASRVGPAGGDRPAGNVGAFRSWLLGYLEHAEVLSPPELRSEVVAWLEGVAR